MDDRDDRDDDQSGRQVLEDVFGMPFDDLDLALALLTNPRAMIEAAAAQLGHDPDAVAAALGFGDMAGVDRIFAAFTARRAGTSGVE